MSLYRYSEYIPGTEKDLSKSKTIVMSRPKWAPTPLNPYNLEKRTRRSLRYPFGRFIPYSQDARETVDKLLDEHDVDDELKHEMATVVISSLFHRFESNNDKTISQDADHDSVRLFEAACNGSARPDQLISLLAISRHLQALELAKQTHPFDWAATKHMDSIVRNEFGSYPNASLYNEPSVRHYLNGQHHIETGIAVFVRKAELGRVCLTGSDIRLVQRDSMLVDLRDSALSSEQAQLMDWTNKLVETRAAKGNKKLRIDPYNFEVAQLAEQQVSLPSDASHHPSFYPAVRSYYAHVS